jgi:hypothetical protein
VSKRSALWRLLSDASDHVVREVLAPRGFKPVPPLGQFTLRRYLQAGEFRDVEIDVFRDNGWTIDGGYVRIGLRSLVHPVQQVIGGVAQTLEAPTPGQPFVPFELGPHPVGSAGTWMVRGPGTVGPFAAGLAAYLREVALPWMAETESEDAVLATLERLGHAEQRERLVRAWGRA